MNDALEDTFSLQLFAAAADPMLVMDSTGKIMLSNPTAQRLFGYPEQKLHGLPVEALMPERYRGSHHEHRAEYARDPRRRPMGLGRDLYGLRRDGSEFAAEISLSPLEGGMVLATIQDVTERKRTEAALRKFSRVIEQTASTVVITNVDGVIEYVNPRFVETTGYTAAEAVGKRPNLLKSGHTTAQEYQDLWRTIADGGVWQGEFLNRRKDGSLYWESAIISAIRNERGRITHFVGIKDDITARKRAEAALRESEKRLRLAQASANVGIWDWNVHTGRMDWTPELEALYGFAPGSFPGTYAAFRSRVHPDDLADMESRRDSAVAARQPFDFDFRILLPSGTVKWVNCKGAAKYYETGAPLRLFGVYVDITARKQAEQITGTQNDLLEMVASGAPLPAILATLTRAIEGLEPDMLTSIMLVDHDGTHLRHVSAPSLPEDYTRGTSRIPIGEGFGGCGTAAWRRKPVIIEDIATDPLEADFSDLALAHGLRACWSTPILDAVGSVLGTFAIFYRAPGPPLPTHQRLVSMATHVAAIAIVRDQEEQALRETEQRFRATFEQAAVGIAHVAPSGRWLRVNRKLCDIVGYSREELLQRNFQDITHPDDLEADLAQARRLIEGEIDNYSRQKRYIRKDGNVAWINFTMSVVRQADNSPDYLIAVVEDIGERKQAEATVRDLRAEMEQLLALHVASQTAAAIAHELNQPLNAVTSYTEAALRMLRAGNPKPDKLHHALENSALQAQRAGQVVRELLLFLQKSDTSTELVDLNDAARRSLAIIEADEYDFQTKLDLAAKLKPVLANRLQVEKVMVNLLRNSLDAMANAGIKGKRITIRTVAADGMGQVTVQDNGPGLDTPTAKRIFEPFFTTKPSGVGMGLTISRTLIEAHGGKLWFEAGSSPGAIFHFALPFAS